MVLLVMVLVVMVLVIRGCDLRFPENNSFVCKIFYVNLHMGFLTIF